jgi:hypothetical protein
MKTIKLYFLFAAVVLIGVSSCKKDKKDTGIIGIWVNEAVYSAPNLVARQTYQFNDDSTVVFTRTLINSDTKAVLGYNYKSTAKFSFDGTTLKQYGISVLGVDQSKIKPGDPYYTPLQDLIPYLTISSVSSNEVAFNADKTKFNFVYPPCPPNASCIGLQLYTKQ